MMTTAIYTIGVNRGRKRLWIDGARLRAAGFLPGVSYTCSISKGVMVCRLGDTPLSPARFEDAESSPMMNEKGSKMKTLYWVSYFQYVRGNDGHNDWLFQEEFFRNEEQREQFIKRIKGVTTLVKRYDWNPEEFYAHRIRKVSGRPSGKPIIDITGRDCTVAFGDSTRAVAEFAPGFIVIRPETPK